MTTEQREDELSARRFPRVVRRLAALGVTPDTVSYVGLACAVGSGLAFALGAGHVLPVESSGAPQSWLPLIGGLLLGSAGLADLLDGDLARGTRLGTRFGGVLDSTLDRFSDVIVLGGAALYFAVRGNATMVAVAIVAITWCTQVSYVKARAENLVDGLGVGFWQRGERWVTLLCGAFLGHFPAALWVLASFPALTVSRRMSVARRRILGLDEPPPPRFAPWREPRTSLPYAAVCLGVVALLWLTPWLHPLFAGRADPLGTLLRLGP